MNATCVVCFNALRMITARNEVQNLLERYRRYIVGISQRTIPCVQQSPSGPGIRVRLSCASSVRSTFETRRSFQAERPRFVQYGRTF